MDLTVVPGHGCTGVHSVGYNPRQCSHYVQCFREGLAGYIRQYLQYRTVKQFELTGRDTKPGLEKEGPAFPSGNRDHLGQK